MTLEDAFKGRLTSNVKGLQKLSVAIERLAKEIKGVVERGDLAALKVKLTEMRGKVGEVDKLLAAAVVRAAELTVDEARGEILDLSVPADERK